MHSFLVIAIPTEVADYVRASGKSPVYGFPAHKEVAAGRAPCRHCLNLIQEQQEELLLFIYDPFREMGAPPLPGPVYLHSKNCMRHEETQNFPPVYEGRQLTFDAYGRNGELLSATYLTGGGEAEQADRLFGDPRLQYIHVRSTEAGCFLFRLQRA